MENNKKPDLKLLLNRLLIKTKPQTYKHHHQQQQKSQIKTAATK